MAPLALVLVACALAVPSHAASLPLPSSPAGQDGIPVAVVLDAAEPSVKLNEVEFEEPLRAEPDLLHPGAPQRQEHETQNPERHSDEGLKVSGIRESIERTRDLLTQSLRDTSASVQSWLASGDDQTHIQRSIQSLRDTFSTQIQKLNDTIHTLMKPEESAHAEESERKFEAIESKLKSLTENFNDGIDTLSAGVDVAALLKSTADDGEAKEESGAAPAASSTAAPPAPAGPVVSFFGQLSDSMVAGLNSVMNIIRPPAQAEPPAGAQADTPAETPNRPGIFGNLGNFTLPALPSWTQNLSPSSIQSNIQQNLQNFQNLFRPSTTAPKPAEAPGGAASEPVRTEPAAAAPPAADKPAEADKPAPAVEATTQGGPIRQFLNSIPVVQRIQSALGNRDSPRQPASDAPAAAAAPAPAAAAAPAAAEAPASAPVPAPAPVTADGDAQTKGGWYGGPRPGASGDSNNSNGLSELRFEEIKEDIKVETEPAKEVEEPMKEVQEPKKEVKEPMKEVQEPKKVVKEPMKEVQEPKKEVKEPMKEVQEPKKEEKEPMKEGVTKNKVEELKPEPVADKTE